MTPLPKAYAWLADEPGPRILKVALATYGTAEQPGPGNNPSIMAWAKATGQDRVYRNDDTAWCGLTMAYWALEAGFPFEGPNPLGARNWLSWGNSVDRPALADALVFWRGSKTGWLGHVGMYVGEDMNAFHVLGGNQGDRVSIKRIDRTRLLGARRCKWRIAQPSNVRAVLLSPAGAMGGSEA